MLHLEDAVNESRDRWMDVADLQSDSLSDSLCSNSVFITIMTLNRQLHPEGLFTPPLIFMNASGWFYTLSC